MKLHTRIFGIMSALFIGVAAMSSCVNEEAFSTAGKKPVEAPVVMAGEVSTSSITFSWAPVENAGQYYCRVVNPLGYVVYKETTKETSVTAKGLKFSTEFTVYVKAIPDAASSKKFCASDETQITIKTDDPIIINYEWVKDGTAWFYGDGNTWNKSKVTVGLEQGTNHFIVSSWIGSDGFDLYFDIKDWDGSYPINFHYSNPTFQPVIGQAIDQSGPLGDRGDIRLGHGLGGKAFDFIYWYGNGASYDQGVIDPTGGYIDLWCKDYDDKWCGYRIEFGEYAPEPEPDPVPDADASNSWSSDVLITCGETELGMSTLSFDAAKSEYTLTSWYGVEGYDVVFTRNEKTGDWIIDPSCSAYAETDEETGNVALYHGLGKVKPYSVCWIKAGEWVSGLSGNEELGNLYASIIDPTGVTAQYRVDWPVDNGDLDYDWEATGTFTFNVSGRTGTATVSYVASTCTYTISGWCGAEGSDIVFTRDRKGYWVVDQAATNCFVRVGDYGEMGLSSGIEGTATSWFYENQSGMEGDDKAGSLYITGWSPDGKWETYTLAWVPGSWSKKGHAVCEGPGLDIDATISFNVETGKYTITSWFGVEGYDLVFTLNGSNVIPDTESAAFRDESSDRWNIRPDDSRITSIFKDAESSTFKGGKAGGTLVLGTPGWFYDTAGWTSYIFEW